jgi:hypothetical protein
MIVASVPRRAAWAGLLAMVLVARVGSARSYCAHSCPDDLAACKRTRCEAQRGPDRRHCLERCRGSTGCGGGIGTLAYVVSTCRVQGDSQTGTQELRIRRRGCDPVTVARFANPQPVSDQIGLCALGSKNHSGRLSVLAGVFQRLGVTADGSGIVFEVSNRFQLTGRLDLTPEQQGFFYVRADGTGLRRVGDSSRDPVYRIFKTRSGYSADAKTEIAFSLDDRKIAYTDRGPGTSGAESDQIVTLDLGTGERRQLTRFEPLVPPRPSEHRLGWVQFFPDAIGFTYHVGDWRWFNVHPDGTNLHDTSALTNIGDGMEGHVERTFGVSVRRLVVQELALPGVPEDSDVFPGAGRREIFRAFGHQHIQLTNLNRADTYTMGSKPGSVLFMSSGDPLGANPFQNCQLFHVPPLGGDLRQLTRFGEGVRSEKGCGFDSVPGCGIETVPRGWSSPRSLVFYSDCDPLGANPDGSQVFAIDYDGSHLRQLTHTAGATHGADGSLELELPGPIAGGGG